jgi:hypothetical protein
MKIIADGSKTDDQKEFGRLIKIFGLVTVVSHFPSFCPVFKSVYNTFLTNLSHGLRRVFGMVKG